LLGLAGWEVAFRWAPDREEVLWRDLRVVHAVNFCSDLRIYTNRGNTLKCYQ
jgi:hypothetical protein